MAYEGLKEDWEKVLDLIADRFGMDEAELSTVLFLIGVQELGQGFRKFKKQEKMELIHVAICELLSEYGYYEFVGKDEDGWPHYQSTEKLPPLSEGQQQILLKEAIVLYFKRDITE